MNDRANHPAEPQSGTRQAPQTPKPQKQLAPNRCRRPPILYNILGMNPNEPRVKSVLNMICGPYYSPHISFSSKRGEAIKAGAAWPSYRELLLTQNFFLDDLYADLAKSCQFLLRYEAFTQKRLQNLNTSTTHKKYLRDLTQNLFELIRTLSTNPTLEGLQEISQALHQWQLNIPKEHWNIFEETEILGRMAFYFACAYHETTIAKIASACWQEALRITEPIESIISLEAAIGWLRKNNLKIIPSVYLSELQYNDLQNGQITDKDLDAVSASIYPNAHPEPEPPLANASSAVYDSKSVDRKAQISTEDFKVFVETMLRMLRDMSE